MRFLPAAALILSLTATTATADVADAVEQEILPGTAAFAEATEALQAQAHATCLPNAELQEAWNDAFDGWMGISHLRFGPLEVDGRVNAIAFWPDKKGFTPRMLGQMVADEDGIVDQPDEFHELSVAARGLFALEYLLYDDQFAGYEADSYSCRLVQAISADLARMAEEIDQEWHDEAAPALLSAGEAGNTTYLDRDEAVRVLYTSLLSGLEFTADSRLGRPMGTFDRPRASRAEARRSGRSLRNVTLSLEALQGLARALMAPDEMPQSEAAFASVFEAIEAVETPDLSQVDEISGRLKVEIVQQRVQLLRRTVEGEVGGHFGLSAGFNSADGD